MMKSKCLNTLRKSSVTTTLLLLGINLIAYSFLPDKLVSHWGMTGQADGSIPKLLFLAAMPVINFIFSIFYENKKNNPILFNVLFIALNLFILAINLQ